MKYIFLSILILSGFAANALAGDFSAPVRAVADDCDKAKQLTEQQDVCAKPGESGRTDRHISSLTATGAIEIIPCYSDADCLSGFFCSRAGKTSAGVCVSRKR